MRAAALAAALLCAAGPARADLSFVQVTQAQSSAGADGLFGKTWVEVRGRKMRLVSGYARKMPAKGGAPDPRRRVQILDAAARTRTVIDPARRAYAVGALGPPDYGHGLETALKRGAPARRIVRHEFKLTKRPGTRTLLGAECERWQLTLTLRLLSLNGREEAARMDQSLWVAPLSGDMAKSLMELIAFDNAYREAAGGELSPLDHERYQVREAAAYLEVPEAELAKVVGQVRERLRELPSYPAASSVSWWRDEGPTVRPSEPAPTPKAERRPAPKPRLVKRMSKPSFRVLDWRREERRINGMYERTRTEFGEFPLGGLDGGAEKPRLAYQARPVYPRFEEELRAILKELISAVEAEEAAQARARGPFFEVYAELHGLENTATVSEAHFTPPAKYRKIDAPRP
ncbi:MAG: hypothetical protein HYZ75_15245 [Elusimicrobia bacterium]|nr:hypothetical protein [Elusimicrobiota bacterium]